MQELMKPWAALSTWLFASWEPGSNANFNGLLRQNVPKKRLLKNVSNDEIKTIENRLNNRTRKRSVSKHLLRCSTNRYPVCHLLFKFD